MDIADKVMKEEGRGALKLLRRCQILLPVGEECVILKS